MFDFGLKKRGRHVYILFLIGFLMISGCNAVSRVPQRDTPKVEQKVQGAADTAGVELRMFMVQRSDEPLDAPVFKELEQRLGCRLKWITTPEADARRGYSLVMSSGDIPDVVIHEFAELQKYFSAGTFEPLNLLIEKYAPHLEKELLVKAENRKAITYADGNIYSIPKFANQLTSEIFMIRKDWLDTLQLQEPVRIEDWYEVLKKFKEGDPNKNGKKDEIPFINRQGHDKILPFIQAWGIQQEFFIENGQLKYGPTDPRMKDALSWLSRLYREGLIDREYTVCSQMQWQMKAVSGVGGAMQDWINRMQEFNEELQKTNSNARFAAVLPPVGPSGKSMTTRQMSRVRNVGHASIASKSRYKKEAIKLFDYIFSNEGHTLLLYGQKDVHYTIGQNGKPKYTDLILKNPLGKAPPIALCYYGMARNMPGRADPDWFNAMSFNESYIRANEMYEKVIIPTFPEVLPFTDEERGNVLQKYAEIRTYVQEMTDKFIMGTIPIEEYEGFVRDLKRMGIEEIMNLNWRAYQRYSSN